MQELFRLIHSYFEDLNDLENALDSLENFLIEQDLDDDVVDSLIKDLNYCLPDIRFGAGDVLDIVDDLINGIYTVQD